MPNEERQIRDPQRERQARLNMAKREQRKDTMNSDIIIPPRRKKSAFKKAMPYLISGGATSAGIGAALTGFLT